MGAPLLLPLLPMAWGERHRPREVSPAPPWGSRGDPRPVPSPSTPRGPSPPRARARTSHARAAPPNPRSGGKRVPAAARGTLQSPAPPRLPGTLEVLVVGLSGAGKTSLVHRLAGEVLPAVEVPTVGFQNRRVSLPGLTLKVWDFGGRAQSRGMGGR